MSGLEGLMVTDGVMRLRVGVEACWMNNWGSNVSRRTTGRLFCKALEKTRVERLSIKTSAV